MRNKKLNLDRMRKYRYRTLPHFQVQYINKEMLDQFDVQGWDFFRIDFLEQFALQMRIRHIWFPKNYDIVSSMDFDIDFNRYRITLEERFVR